MKRLSWRYVSNIHVYNSFFLAYAEKVILSAKTVSVRLGSDARKGIFSIDGREYCLKRRDGATGGGDRGVTPPASENFD